MRILFLTDNFPPEVNAPATRTFEHCKEWVENGVEVTVITCTPNFPQGKVYHGYSNKLFSKETIDGIKVIRVWSYITANQGFIKRTLDYLSFAASSFLAGLGQKTDVIVATSPQFFTTWSGWLLSKIKRKPWIFELRDLWPESIATVGALKKGKLYRFLEYIELSLYKSADLIIPNTPAFKKNLTERGIPKDKIKVVPNGANMELFSVRPKNEKLKQRLNITEEKVVGYIGTHGMAHSLDFILKCIYESDIKECHFLFIGDGAEKKNLVSYAEEKSLKNVTFLDPVLKDSIPDYLSIVDISLVPLKKTDTFKTVIPSKIFESSAMGKPILLGVEGQAQEIIEKFDAGLCFEPENQQDFKLKLYEILNDNTVYSTLSKNSLTLANTFDRKVLAKKMQTHIKNLYDNL